MKKTWIFALTCWLVLLGNQAFAQQFAYASIDVPCSANPPTNCPNGVALQTIASGINARGDIVGIYVDGMGNQHGFLLSSRETDREDEDGSPTDGEQETQAYRFTTIDVPGALAGVTGTLTTSPNGINSEGEIVGNYTAPVNTTVAPDSPLYCPALGSAACIKGFLYRHGEFSTVLFPGHPGAVPQRITSRGDIYGCLHDLNLMSSMFGAAWKKSGDVSLTMNGGMLADGSMSYPMSMANGATPHGDMVVGFFNDMNTGQRHGFVVRDSMLTQYDVPGSHLTAIWDVNPRRQFVGTYLSSTNHRYGFLQPADGSAPIQLEYPCSTATVAFGINPEGAIVGQYALKGVVHGFLAVPATNVQPPVCQ